MEMCQKNIKNLMIRTVELNTAAIHDDIKDTISSIVMETIEMDCVVNGFAESYKRPIIKSCLDLILYHHNNIPIDREKCAPWFKTVMEPASDNNTATTDDDDDFILTQASTDNTNTTITIDSVPWKTLDNALWLVLDIVVQPFLCFNQRKDFNDITERANLILH